MKTQYSQKTLFILAFSLLINSFMFSQSCNNNIATFSPISTERESSDSERITAQVFTASSTVSHFDVTLALATCEKYGCDAQLDIVTVTAGEPEWSNVIGSAIIPESEIYTYPDCILGSFGASSFSFSGVTLNSGIQYALVLKPAPGSASNSQLDWRRSSFPDDPQNPYTGGNAWTYDIMLDMPMDNKILDLQFDICENSFMASQYCDNPLAGFNTDNTSSVLAVANVNEHAAQVFTATRNVSHFNIALKMGISCDGYTISGAKLDIVSVNSNGEPNWTNIIGTATVSKNKIYFDENCDGSGLDTTIFSFYNTSLVQGEQYAIVLKPASQSDTNGSLYWNAYFDTSSSSSTNTNSWLHTSLLSENPTSIAIGLYFHFEICESTSCLNNIATFSPISTESLSSTSNKNIAQVFTASSSVSHFDVTLALATCKNMGSSNAQLDIVTVSAGKPNWNDVIGSAIVTKNLIYENPDCNEKNFDNVVFSFNNVSLKQGIQYALVLKPASGANIPNEVLWQLGGLYDGTNSYTGGNPWTYEIATNTSNQNTTADLQFSICENLPSCNGIADYYPINNSHLFGLQSFNNQYSAQVFTANSFVSYFNVTLPLAARIDGNNGAKLNIVTVTNGEPNWNNVIGTAIATKDQIYTLPDGYVDETNITYGATIFSFNNVPLTNNSQYALVLEHNLGNNTSSHLYWKTSYDNVRYSGGDVWLYNTTNNLSEHIEYIDSEFGICETAPPCTNNVGTYIPFGTEAKRINTAAHAAQVFTALSSVSNFNVILGLAGSTKDNLNAAQLDIVTVTNGAPDWTNVIGSTTVPNDQIYSEPNREPGTFGGTTFTFNNVPLTSGVQYALVLKVLPFQGASPTFALYWQTSELGLDGTNPYNGGNSWSYLMRYRRGLQNTNHDAQFLICEASTITDKEAAVKTNTNHDTQALTLYPNPAKDFITVTGLVKPEKYIIYNMLGVVIGNGSISNNEKINIKNLSYGNYIVKFENGQVNKFIKN